jgi:peptidoglycan/LPS O-acetylase OafA/YrhL
VLGLLALEQYVTLTNKWLHSLGDATYSIYLTHLYIVMMMYRVVRHVPIDSMLSYIIPLVSLLVCAVAGIAVYNVAEQRLIAAAKELFVPHSAGLAA